MRYDDGIPDREPTPRDVEQATRRPSTDRAIGSATTRSADGLPRRLADLLHAYERHLIAGERAPTIQSLADTLGIGRPTVHEYLQALVIRGRLTHPSRGVYLPAPSRAAPNREDVERE
jgi:DNA-binding FadR family transcriptional regulator